MMIFSHYREGGYKAGKSDGTSRREEVVNTTKFAGTIRLKGKFAMKKITSWNRGKIAGFLIAALLMLQVILSPFAGLTEKAGTSTDYLAVTDFTFTVKADGSVEVGVIAGGDTVVYKNGKIVVTDKTKTAETDKKGWNVQN